MNLMDMIEKVKVITNDDSYSPPPEPIIEKDDMEVPKEYRDILVQTAVAKYYTKAEKTMFKKYVQKQPIEAVEWTGDNDLYEYLEASTDGHVYRETRNVLSVTNGSHINGLTSYDELRINDYLIRYPNGTYAVMKAEEFERLYADTSTFSHLMPQGVAIWPQSTPSKRHNESTH